MYGFILKENPASPNPRVFWGQTVGFGGVLLVTPGSPQVSGGWGWWWRPWADAAVAWVGSHGKGQRLWQTPFAVLVGAVGAGCLSGK